MPDRKMEFRVASYRDVVVEIRNLTGDILSSTDLKNVVAGIDKRFRGTGEPAWKCDAGSGRTLSCSDKVDYVYDLEADVLTDAEESVKASRFVDVFIQTGRDTQESVTVQLEGRLRETMAELQPFGEAAGEAIVRARRAADPGKWLAFRSASWPELDAVGKLVAYKYDIDTGTLTAYPVPPKEPEVKKRPEEMPNRMNTCSLIVEAGEQAAFVAKALLGKHVKFQCTPDPDEMECLFTVAADAEAANVLALDDAVRLARLAHPSKNPTEHTFVVSVMCRDSVDAKSFLAGLLADGLANAKTNEYVDYADIVVKVVDPIT